MQQAASIFFWVMGFGLFTATSLAACLDIDTNVGSMKFKQDKGSPKVGDYGNCIDIEAGCGDLGKMAFMKMPFTMTVNLDYDAGSLSVNSMAFKQSTIVLNLECGSGCGNGNCGGSTSPTTANCGCPIRTNSLGAGGHTGITVKTCCSGFTGCGDGPAPVSPSPDPPPPPPPPHPSPPPPSPSPPAAVCGTGTIFDAISGKCKINCDENDPPGRRLSERPLTPADAAASDTAKESREQSTRARKAIDSHLASQPDLDDAQRSALSYHLERLAAESLWFPEEE